MKRTRRLIGLLVVVSGSILAAASGASGDEPPRSDLTSKAIRARLLELYRGEAASYTIYRDASRTEKVELRSEPVYVWTNPVRNKGQDGAVFVWTCRGRAEVIATFFTFPPTGPRNLYHELHSLGTTVLDVTRTEDDHEWRPTAAGITLTQIDDAPDPAPTAPRRLAQMRTLTNDFSARSQDFQGRKWELRLLPQPLYRYQSTDPEVLDGAVFSFVTTAGTDPEILLVIEARAKPGEGRTRWQYALARFSDLDLWVQHKGKEIYSATRIPWNSPRQDPMDRHRSFRARVIPPVEEETPVQPLVPGSRPR